MYSKFTKKDFKPFNNVKQTLSVSIKEQKLCNI